VPRQTLLFAVLLYVTLDLSLAAMPGAFVFEPAGSVEGTHGVRPHRMEPIVAAQAPVADSPITLSRPAVAPSPGIQRVRPARCVVSCLPRAILAPPRSEDPY
jgi:hypothetical protein